VSIVGTAFDDRIFLRMTNGRGIFRRFSHRVALAVGAPSAFVIALVLVLVWAITGPMFGYSDTWQLTINTATTIITFLMVFVIQNTQNRDSQVIQLKLDELIRAVREARNELVDMEDLSDDELHRLQHQFEALRKAAEEARALRR
jgi:low affinity Fe/Cu permease